MSPKDGEWQALPATAGRVEASNYSDNICSMRIDPDVTWQHVQACPASHHSRGGTLRSTVAILLLCSRSSK
eukprot:m.565863 g.565863  ORF g.565863 m.565863 type:complete len:71 (+) comp22245_c0_seq18:5124-5336(+)